jgi:hypothetical protein
VEQWEELFAAIHARLERAVTTGDFTPVLEPGVLEEARRLAELASSDRANMEIAHIGGWLHWARYHGAADDRDLNTAIDAFTRCFIAGVDDVPDELLPVLAKQAVPVGNARIRELLQGTADQDRTGATASLWQRIVNTIPADDPDGPAYLSNFGVALLAWFGHTRAPADLDTAIDTARAAVAVAPAEFPDRAVLLSNLANALYARFMKAGARPDLDAAIEAYEAAVRSSGTGHPARAVHWSNLGAALQARFGQTGDPADLDAEVKAFEAALRSTPADDPNKVLYLYNLGFALQTRFERKGDAADLDAAIEFGQAAVNTAPHGDPQLAMMLSNLGAALLTRSVQTQCHGL